MIIAGGKELSFRVAILILFFLTQFDNFLTVFVIIPLAPESKYSLKELSKSK